MDPYALISAVESVCVVRREDFRGAAKGARAELAKEVLILSGRQLGVSLTALSAMAGLSLDSTSCRHDIARGKLSENSELASLRDRIVERCTERAT